MPPPRALLLEEKAFSQDREALKSPCRVRGRMREAGCSRALPTMGGEYKLSSLGGSQEGEKG